MNTREKILAQREAFVEGARRHGAHICGAREAAVRAYPMPMVARPRVAPGIAGRHYRVVDGLLQVSLDGRRWAESLWTQNTLGQVLALFDRPTEFVEDE